MVSDTRQLVRDQSSALLKKQRPKIPGSIAKDLRKYSAPTRIDANELGSAPNEPDALEECSVISVH